MTLGRPPKPLDAVEIEFLKESNAIEGVYDEDSLAQAVEAWKYLKKRPSLTVGIILKTHKILMLNQNTLYPNEKGYFRRIPVYVGGRECLNWREIDTNIKSWIADAHTSVSIPGDDGKHIRFDHISYEKIHPFVDGNGRTGRLFLNWQRVKAGLPLLVIHSGKEQTEYYKWFR